MVICEKNVLVALAVAVAVAGVIDDAIAAVVALLGEAAWSSIVVVVVVGMEVVEMQAWVVRWSRPIHSRLY